VRLFWWLALTLCLHAQTGDNVLLVVNKNVPISRQIADYYRPRRSVPVKNVCTIDTTGNEEIQWGVYEEQIERPIAECLKKAGLVDKVLYIVTTMGVPLKVDGPGSRQLSERASVDSELALLYAKLKGRRYSRMGDPQSSPCGAIRNSASRLPHLSGHLPGRLRFSRRQGDDRPLAQARWGKFVLDLRKKDEPGNDWLRTAAMLLPSAVVLDETTPALQPTTSYASCVQRW
jgi:uncharacterized protein (TIGR03790 family)